MAKNIIFLARASGNGMDGLEKSANDIVQTAKQVSELMENKKGIIFSSPDISSQNTAKIIQKHATEIDAAPNMIINDLDRGGFLWSKSMAQRIQNVPDTYDYAVLIANKAVIAGMPQTRNIQDKLSEVIPLSGIVLGYNKNWKTISSRTVRETSVECVIQPGECTPV